MVRTSLFLIDLNSFLGDVELSCGGKWFLRDLWFSFLCWRLFLHPEFVVHTMELSLF